MTEGPQELSCPLTAPEVSWGSPQGPDGRAGLELQPITVTQETARPARIGGASQCPCKAAGVLECPGTGTQGPSGSQQGRRVCPGAVLRLASPPHVAVICSCPRVGPGRAIGLEGKSPAWVGRGHRCQTGGELGNRLESNGEEVLSSLSCREPQLSQEAQNEAGAGTATHLPHQGCGQ